jgi:hypothetical protein
MRSFYQDRLGTNIGETQNRDAFCAGRCDPPLDYWFASDEPGLAQVRKRHFLSHLYIKCIILPRQARDKHRENSKKVPFSRSAALAPINLHHAHRHARRRTLGQRFDSRWRVIRPGACWRQGQERCEQRLCFAQFLYQNDHFAKTGSGQA